MRPTCVLFFYLLSFVVASPSITFPIAAQYPPVARAGQAFHFQFAPTTFTSADQTPLTYRIDNAPSWLALDSYTRVFSGTPLNGEAGSAGFELTATDDTGSVETRITFVVTRASDIEPPADISGQLMKYGTLSAPQSLSYTTGASFEITFASNTFIGPLGMTYAATSANNSPLPSWINFDSQTLTFSGLTPPLTAIPQAFGIRLIATLLEGFSEASVIFFLVINDHRLGFQPFERTLNAIPERAFSYADLFDELLLDGKVIAKGELVSATADTPAWLNFDPTTLVLSGKPPWDATSLNISVRVSDIYQDSADALIRLHFRSSSLFQGQIGEINVAIGRWFSYTIDRDIFSPDELPTTVILSDSPSWLHFNKSTLTLYGRVPSGVRPQTLQGTLIATSTSTSDSQTFGIRIIGPKPLVKPSHRASKTHSTPQISLNPTTPPSKLKKGTTGNSNGLGENSKVGIGIGVTVVFLLILAAILLWRKIRLHRDWRWLNSTRSKFETDRKGNIGVPGGENTEKGEAAEFTRNQSPPPQLHFQFKKLQTNSAEVDTVSPFGDVDANLSKPRAPESVLLEGMGTTASDQLGHHSPGEAERYKRRNRRSGHSSRRRSGLPNQRAPVGLGHGRASNGPWSRIAFGNNPISAYRDSGSWYTSSSGSTYSSRGQLDSFPQAPRVSRNTLLESVPENTRRRTVRRVSSSGEHSQSDLWLDERPMEEKRQSYVRRRASTNHSNVIFGSRVGQTPSETSSRRTRLEQRSRLYRSRSSSVGVSASMRADTRAIPESHESELVDPGNVETSSASLQATVGNEGDEHESGGVSMLHVLEEGPPGKKKKLSRRMSRTGFRWATGAALPPESLHDDERSTARHGGERMGSKGPQSNPNIPRATEMELQSTAGSKMQRLVSTGTLSSESSGAPESARFI